MNEMFLVVGAGTYIGINVVNKLIKQKKKVRVLLNNGSKIKFSGNCENFYGKIDDREVNEQFFRKSKKDIVYVINCFTDSVINDKVISFCEIYKIDKYVFVTDDFNYKIDNDILNITGIIHSYIIGPGDCSNNICNIYLFKLKKGEIKKFVDSNINVIDIRDLANGIINASLYGKNKVIYNLTSDTNSIRNILDSFAEISNSKKIKKYYTSEILIKKENLMKKYCELKKIKPYYDQTLINNITKFNSLSNELSVKDLDFSCRSLLLSLKDTNDFFDKVIS